MKINFLKVVEKDFDIVNSLIIEYLESEVGLVENIGHYIVDAGGKRFRPLLVLLSALANGYKGADHTKMAVIVEFIHTATLLHDDVVDVASLRRGRQTANIQWGNAPSVLVGDFLYSRAFQLLVQVADMSIMSVMADATNVISEGEVKQMSNAGNAELTEITYRDVIYRKTAKLFEAACRVGAILANVEEAEMLEFGKHLGMAFQITDDLLDYQGTREVIGKNIGSDLAEGKMTLPLIYTRDNGGEKISKLIRKSVATESAEGFELILDEIEKSGGLLYCQAQAESEVRLAKNSLKALPSTKYKDALIELADFSIQRVR